MALMLGHEWQFIYFFYFVLLHPCLRILLAIYSGATACMRQLMCTAVSQLSSDQLVPLHHSAYLLCHAFLHFYNI
jgi:hypothetical protein